MRVLTPIYPQFHSIFIFQVGFTKYTRDEFLRAGIEIRNAWIMEVSWVLILPITT